MQKKFVWLLLLMVFTAFTQMSFAQTGEEEFRNGVMDLSGWNREESPMLTLDGEWEFYWNELLSPEDFHTGSHEAAKKWIELPRAWNNFELDGEKLSGSGFATFRLLITNPGDELLGIKIPRIFTSYRMWANGDLLASAGETATAAEQMKPQYLPQIHFLQGNTDPIELVLQVSNASHRSGGILESIWLGTAEAVVEIRICNLALDLFLFGSLFVIGLYHIALFLYRTKDKSSLYLGIYSILISLRTLFVGEIFFIHLFPGFPWELAHKIQTTAYYYGIPLVFSYLRTIFPKDVSKKANHVIQIIGAAFSLLVLTTPARIFTLVNPVYQVFSICTFGYVLWIVLITCIRKRPGAYLLGFGLTMMVFTALNDVLFLSVIVADSHNHFLRNFVTRGDLSSIGLLVLTLTQALVLARKFSGSFSQVELLTAKLRSANKGLEEKVKERTLALETSREELKVAYQAVSRSEKSLQNLMQNVSHDLRTPISSVIGYINTILDGIVKDPWQQQEYLIRARDKSYQMSNMVQELFELSQLESRQFQLQYTEMSVIEFILYFSEKCSLDMHQAKVSFKIIKPGAHEDSFLHAMFVKADVRKMERVFANLINNAVKYTPADGQIDLTFALNEENSLLQVNISDTGIGICEEDRAHIFERFYIVSKARKAGKDSNGLGLAIVKEILASHGSQIEIQSEPGKGSRFFFSLSVYQRKIDQGSSL